MARFSKGAMLEQMHRLADDIAEIHHFTHNNGWSQLKPKNGKPLPEGGIDALIVKTIEYGRWLQLCNFIDQFENR